jgi:hypothetical protein
MKNIILINIEIKAPAYREKQGWAVLGSYSFISNVQHHFGLGESGDRLTRNDYVTFTINHDEVTDVDGLKEFAKMYDSFGGDNAFPYVQNAVDRSILTDEMQEENYGDEG